MNADRVITSEDVITPLVNLFSMRDVPTAIRSNNGPEFMAREEFETVTTDRGVEGRRQRSFGKRLNRYQTPADFANRIATSVPGRVPTEPLPAPAIQRHCGRTQRALS